MSNTYMVVSVRYFTSYGFCIRYMAFCYGENFSLAIPRIFVQQILRHRVLPPTCLGNSRAKLRKHCESRSSVFGLLSVPIIVASVPLIVSAATTHCAAHCLFLLQPAFTCPVRGVCRLQESDQVFLRVARCLVWPGTQRV